MDNIEQIYSNGVDIAHRKRFGQFFTHPSVASFMVDWVLSSKSRSLYDPAFGLGAFYHAAKSIKKLIFTGSEIDPSIIKFWHQEMKDKKVIIREENYLKAWGREYDNIVCNPPYMRFQKFLDREQIYQEFYDKTGLSISGYTNIASVFLLKSLSELKQGGRLAYVMPLEFLNTGYGVLIKKKLIEKQHLKAIISLNCEKDVFPDVITSVGIVLVDSAHKSDYVDFYNVDDIDDLKAILTTTPVNSIAISELQPSEKWMHYLKSHKVNFHNKHLTQLSYYGKFVRGIATGANDFFVASKQYFMDLKIHDKEIVACITRSSQINKPFFSQSDYDALEKTDANVFLFSPNGEVSPSAQRYIQWGESSGYNKRFLAKTRNPWYKTELRYPSPILIGVFSRGGYKIIRNTSRALNLTCYHGFQSNLFGDLYVDHLFLYLLSDAGRKILSLNMRRYGDSLDKFEPNDLNQSLVPLPEFFDVIPKKHIDNAIRTVQCSGVLPQYMQDVFAAIIAD